MRTKYSVLAVAIILLVLLGVLVFVAQSRLGGDSAMTLPDALTFSPGDAFSYGVEVLEDGRGEDMRALLISKLEARGPIPEGNLVESFIQEAPPEEEPVYTPATSTQPLPVFPIVGGGDATVQASTTHEISMDEDEVENSTSTIEENE